MRAALCAFFAASCAADDAGQGPFDSTEAGETSNGGGTTEVGETSNGGGTTEVGETSNGGGTTSSETGSQADPFASLGKAYCRKLFSCCDSAELSEQLKFYDPTPASEAECIAIVGGLVSYEADSILAAEAAGRVTFHLDQIEPCAAGIDAAACEDWRVRGDPFRDLIDHVACAAMVEPLTAEGEECRHDRECVSENCDLFDRVCGPPFQAPGDPCGLDLVCDKRSYCDPFIEPSVCVQRAPAGEPCPFDNACVSRMCEGATGTGAILGTCQPLCGGS